MVMASSRGFFILINNKMADLYIFFRHLLYVYLAVLRIKTDRDFKKSYVLP